MQLVMFLGTKLIEDIWKTISERDHDSHKKGTHTTTKR